MNFYIVRSDLKVLINTVLILFFIFIFLSFNRMTIGVSARHDTNKGVSDLTIRDLGFYGGDSNYLNYGMDRTPTIEHLPSSKVSEPEYVGNPNNSRGRAFSHNLFGWTEAWEHLYSTNNFSYIDTNQTNVGSSNIDSYFQPQNYFTLDTGDNYSPWDLLHEHTNANTNTSPVTGLKDYDDDDAEGYPEGSPNHEYSPFWTYPTDENNQPESPFVIGPHPYWTNGGVDTTETHHYLSKQMTRNKHWVHIHDYDNWDSSQSQQEHIPVMYKEEGNSNGSNSSGTTKSSDGGWIWTRRVEASYQTPIISQLKIEDTDDELNDINDKASSGDKREWENNAYGIAPYTLNGGMVNISHTMNNSYILNDEFDSLGRYHGSLETKLENNSGSDYSSTDNDINDNSEFRFDNIKKGSKITVVYPDAGLMLREDEDSTNGSSPAKDSKIKTAVQTNQVSMTDLNEDSKHPQISVPDTHNPKDQYAGEYYPDAVNVKLEIEVTNLYHPWIGPRSLLISKDLSNGIRVNGIVGLRIRYYIYDDNGRRLELRYDKFHQTQNTHFQIRGLVGNSKIPPSSTPPEIDPSHAHYGGQNDYYSNEAFVQESDEHPLSGSGGYDYSGGYKYTGTSFKPENGVSTHGFATNTRVYRLQYNSLIRDYSTNNLFHTQGDNAIGDDNEKPQPSEYDDSGSHTYSHGISNGTIFAHSIIFGTDGDFVGGIYDNADGYAGFSPYAAPHPWPVHKGYIRVHYVDARDNKVIKSCPELVAFGQYGGYQGQYFNIRGYNYKPHNDNVDGGNINYMDLSNQYFKPVNDNQPSSSKYVLCNWYKGDYNLKHHYDTRFIAGRHLQEYIYVTKFRKPKNYPTKLVKKNTNQILTHPGETFSYSVAGKVPVRSAANTYHSYYYKKQTDYRNFINTDSTNIENSVNEDADEGLTKVGVGSPIMETIYNYYAKHDMKDEFHNDKYSFYDNIPKFVSIKNIKLNISGPGITSNGDHSATSTHENGTNNSKEAGSSNHKVTPQDGSSDTITAETEPQGSNRIELVGNDAKTRRYPHSSKTYFEKGIYMDYVDMNYFSNCSFNIKVQVTANRLPTNTIPSNSLNGTDEHNYNQAKNGYGKYLANSTSKQFGPSSVKYPATTANGNSYKDSNGNIIRKTLTKVNGKNYLLNPKSSFGEDLDVNDKKNYDDVNNNDQSQNGSFKDNINWDGGSENNSPADDANHFSANYDDKYSTKPEQYQTYQEPTGQGWFRFWNQAHANEQDYRVDYDNDLTINSQTTENRIKREKFHIYQYDLNWNGKGSGFSDIDKTMQQLDGENDQLHCNFSNKKTTLTSGTGNSVFNQNSIIKETTGYGYFGSHVFVPIMNYQRSNHEVTTSTKENAKGPNPDDSSYNYDYNYEQNDVPSSGLSNNGVTYERPNEAYKFAYGEKKKDEFPVIGEWNDNPTTHDKNSNDTKYQVGKSFTDSKDSSKSQCFGNPDSSYGKDGNSPSSDDTSMSFFKPYIAPDVKISRHGRLIINTNDANHADSAVQRDDNTNTDISGVTGSDYYGKGSSSTDKNKGLPFRLDFNTQNVLTNPDTDPSNNNELRDFENGKILVHIDDDKNGAVLYETAIPMSHIFSSNDYAHSKNTNQGNEYHSIHGHLYDGKSYTPGQDIDASVHFDYEPSSHNLNERLNPTSRNPLDMNLSISDVNTGHPSDNPTDSQFKDWDGGDMVNGIGTIATQHMVTNKSFINKRFSPNVTGGVNVSDATMPYINSDGKKYTQFIEPESVIEYFEAPSKVRTQYEALTFRQNHDTTSPDTFKTGYGIRNDLQVKYQGFLQDTPYEKGNSNSIHSVASSDGTSNDNLDTHDATKNQKYQDLYDTSYGINGSGSNFSFPESFNTDKSSKIKYNQNYKIHADGDNNGGIDTSDDKLDDSLLPMNQRWIDYNSLDVSPTQGAGMLDSYYGKKPIGGNNSLGDEYNKDTRTMHNDDKTYDFPQPSGYSNKYYLTGPMENRQEGVFSTNYRFYPRLLSRSNNPYNNNGTAYLDRNYNDVESVLDSDVQHNSGSKMDSDLEDSLSNIDIEASQSTPMISGSFLSGVRGLYDGDSTRQSNNIDSLDKMFTPPWLKLGKYTVVFNKKDESQADSHDSNDDNHVRRLGGNWFNFEDAVPIVATGHMYIADNYPEDGDFIDNHNNDANNSNPYVKGGYGDIHLNKKAFEQYLSSQESKISPSNHSDINSLQDTFSNNREGRAELSLQPVFYHMKMFISGLPDSINGSSFNGSSPDKWPWENLY